MKRIFSLMLLCAAVLFAGCSKDEPATDPDPIAVTGVTLDKATLTLEIGKTATLVATIAPKDAAVTAVVWNSDKPTVATVSDKGVVTAVADGTATITVKTEDGGKTATCMVTVSKAAVAVAEVKLNKTKTSIKGETETLTVTVLPDDATDKTVTWTSSDETVATVVDGVVTAVKTGKATITATSVADNTVKATCEVEVTIVWAVGNLVADGANGAKIGTATDGGLFFQFGSLVGWSTTGSPTVAVSPAGYTGGTSWNSSWTGDSEISATDDAVSGKGDPCRYYLGDPWRLPTKDEYEALFKDQTEFSSTSSPWKWENASATNTASGLTFPASGSRGSYDGSLYGVGTDGYYWSASPRSAGNGYYLYLYSSIVIPSSSYSRATGLSVRCVK